MLIESQLIAAKVMAGTMGGGSDLVKRGVIGFCGASLFFGLMAWLGFLMVFETLHKQLIPSRARRQLAAGVIFTALIGIVGYQFIDNAAHAGGLVAGMLYAAIVFPASSSTERPNSNFVDRFAGSAALAMIMVSTLFAIWKIIHAI